MAEQRAAREAVEGIRLFPDLERMIIAKFGATPEALMLHQFCYWYRKPSMKDRAWLYKTFAEWRDERGLSRRQVDKGRTALTRAGIIEEEYGPYKRVHFRVDFVRLAATLNLSLNPIAHPESVEDGVGKRQTPENGRAVSVCPPENGHKRLSHAGKPFEEAGQSRLHTSNTHDSAYLRGEPSEEGGQFNTGEYAEDYLQEIPLTEGGDGSASRPATKKEEEILHDREGGEAPTDGVATVPSDTQQQRSAKGDGDEPPPDNAAPPVADARRVAKARSALDALFEEWPGYRDDADAGKWRELGMTAKQLGFAEEIFAPVEVELAAGGLGEEATEREAVAVHG
jgi:hypothetical protein